LAASSAAVVWAELLPDCLLYGRNTKSLHTTTNCYLVSLALADLITLLSSCPQEILSYHILGDRYLTTIHMSSSRSWHSLTSRNRG
jgi:hypothetical protein